MAEHRLELDAILRQIVKDACGKENVYYQPPANLRMSYPCICYEKSKIQNAAADNRVYLQRIFYQLTVIDSRPDSKITEALISKMGEEWWFILRDIPAEELEQMALKAQLDYLSMMVDPEL